MSAGGAGGRAGFLVYRRGKASAGGGVVGVRGGWSQDRKRCCRVWGGLAALRVGGCSRGSSVAVMNCER